MDPFRIGVTRVVLAVVVVALLTATTLIALLSTNLTISVILSPLNLTTVRSDRQESCDIVESNYTHWYLEMYGRGFISVDKLNVLYCPIPKNMHRRMLALLGRYIMEKDFDGVTSKSLSTTWKLIESLTKNRTAKIGWIRNLRNKLQSYDNGNKFALIRDPIERFISAYLCFCYRQKNCHSDSMFRCGEDIYCLLGNISRMLLTDKTWKNRAKTLAHFRPQYHFCYFQQCKSAYRLFYYSDSESLSQSLTDYLVKSAFPPQMLSNGWGKFKNSSWLAERDSHNTAERHAVERRNLLSNMTLVNYIYRVYKEDYDFFNLKVPKVYLARCGESQYQRLDMCQLTV